jgi:hypothetical protein
MWGQGQSNRTEQNKHVGKITQLGTWISFYVMLNKSFYVQNWSLRWPLTHFQVMCIDYTSMQYMLGTCVYVGTYVRCAQKILVIKNYNATNSLVRFENKNIFFYTCSLNTPAL